MNALFRHRPLAGLRVEDAMAKRVHSVGPDDWMSTAETRMRDAQVRRLPVVDGAGNVVGIVTQNDLLREVVREWSMGRRDISSEDVLATLDAVGRPRREPDGYPHEQKSTSGS
jgi:CBS-domain-containing membrane protein